MNAVPKNRDVKNRLRARLLERKRQDGIMSGDFTEFVKLAKEYNIPPVIIEQFIPKPKESSPPQECDIQSVLDSQSQTDTSDSSHLESDSLQNGVNHIQ